MTAFLNVVPSWYCKTEPTESNLWDIWKKLSTPIKRVMADTKYVVKKHDPKINVICLLTRRASELVFLLSVNRRIPEVKSPTETVIRRMTL
jgi:hypothetical protein